MRIIEKIKNLLKSKKDKKAVLTTKEEIDLIIQERKKSIRKMSEDIDKLNNELVSNNKNLMDIARKYNSEHK